MLAQIKEKLQDKKYAKLVIGILILLSCFVVFLRHATKTKEVSSAVTVECSTAQIKDASLYISAIGTVVPVISANIKAQVSGQIVKIHFHEGQMVKKNDLLAEIDPAMYKAQLLQYEGQLQRDEALLDNAKNDLKRYEALWKQDSIAKQTLDSQISLVKQYEGNVQLDQALVNTAKLNLTYCKILSPFDGQIGLKQITEGNIIQSSDDVIAVINVVDPIAVTFSISEADLSQILLQQDKNLIVEIYDQDFKQQLVSTTLKSIDNQIDSATGTLKLKAEFNNLQHRFFPNQFVNIKLMIKKIHNATIIPAKALQFGSKGNFVFLIENNKAKVNYVETYPVNNDEVIIKSGLFQDQIIATSGTDKLIEGVEVLPLKN